MATDEQPLDKQNVHIQSVDKEDMFWRLSKQESSDPRKRLRNRDKKGTAQQRRDSLSLFVRKKMSNKEYQTITRKIAEGNE